MDKEWYLIINHRREGPYSIEDLKYIPSFTPDTLVWKRGFQEWIAARFVPELKEVFEDKPESKPIQDKFKSKPLQSDLGQEQATLVIPQDPFPLFFWILFFLIILVYTLYQLYS